MNDAAPALTQDSAVVLASAAAVRLRNVTKTFGAGRTAVPALRGVDLDIAPRQLVMLVGPSGCGKTTLVSIISGVLNADSGIAEVFGQDWANLTSAGRTALRGELVGFVFQQFNLIPTLNAVENVAVPLLLRQIPRRAAMQQAAQALTDVGLGDRPHATPAELSGGQQQRVAIARALVRNPRILVCDEPTASLDSHTGQKIMALIHAASRRPDDAQGRGPCVVVVTHDSRIFHYADRIVAMEDGRMIGSLDVPKSPEEGGLPGYHVHLDAPGIALGPEVSPPPEPPKDRKPPMTKWVTIILALLGLGAGVYTVATSDVRNPVVPPAQPPSVNPFGHGIAASGLVEGVTRNIAIGAPESGIALEVLVAVNDQVKKGQPLLKLDDRLLRAELVEAEAAVAVTTADLARLRAEPRPEDLPSLRASVARRQAELTEANDMYEWTKKMQQQDAASERELHSRANTLEAARATLAEMQANLSRTEAGAWDRDLLVAQARLEQAQARSAAIRLRIERLTINAPCAATVIKRHVEPGQNVSMNSAETPLVLADLSALHVRAQVDEEDAPLLRPGASAFARLRGAMVHEIPLTMLRIEPLAIAKNNLTGSNIERIDTRVIEVIFRMADTGTTSVYPGQIVDVFIDAQIQPTDKPAGS